MLDNTKCEDKEKKEKKGIDVTNAIIMGAALESDVQLHGEAASQMVQAYNGVRVDSKGRDLNHKGRSLKAINKYKVASNPKVAETNIRQQTGFSAELIHEAKSNKEAILAGDPKRVRTTDGIGQTNHQQYDHITVDGNNKPIKGSGTQMKFLKSEANAEDANGFKVINNLANDQSWDRYDGDILIPKGEAEKARLYAKKQAEKLRKQAERLKKDGKAELAKQKELKAERFEKAGKRVKDAKVTYDEAKEARLNPKRYVAKEVLADSHIAGKEAAKGAIGTAALLSTVSNTVALARGDKNLDEAMKDLATDVAVSGASGYLVGTSGSALKAVMHASENQLVRDASRAAGEIVGAGVAIVSSLKRYAEGKIDSVELVEELGEKGVGALTVSYTAAAGTGVGAAIGSFILPGPGTAIGGFIGGYIGGMIGYTFSSFVYHGILDTLKNEKIARERRMYLEELCDGMIRANTLYQIELQEFAERDAAMRKTKVQDIFNRLDNSILDNNLCDYTQAINDMGKFFGADLQFKTPKEFYNYMDTTDPNEPLVI